jgi:hypothetical protein
LAFNLKRGDQGSTALLRSDVFQRICHLIWDDLVSHILRVYRIDLKKERLKCLNLWLGRG